MFTTSSLRLAVALGALVLAPAANAQAVRFSVSQAVSNNNSDNSGINVGGSQVAGNTFGPQNSNAGSGSRTPIGGGGAAFNVPVAGGTVSITPVPTGAPATAFGSAAAQLSSGVLSATAGGSTVTVTMSPATGQLLGQALAGAPGASSAAAAMFQGTGMSASSAASAAGALQQLAEMQAPTAAPPAPPAQAAERAPGEVRARPQQDIPVGSKDPGSGVPSAPSAPTAADAAVVAGPATSAPSAAVHAAAAVALVTESIAAFTSENPNTPLPAPLLATALLVRAAAASVLPLPTDVR